VATLDTLMTSLHLSLEKRLLATMPGSLHDAQTQQWLAMAKAGMRAGISKSSVLPLVRPNSSPAYPAHRTVTVTLQAVWHVLQLHLRRARRSQKQEAAPSVLARPRHC
jgi:hypothetical protein